MKVGVKVATVGAIVSGFAFLCFAATPLRAALRSDNGVVPKFEGGIGPTWSRDGSKVDYIGPAPRFDKVIEVTPSGTGTAYSFQSAPPGQMLAETRSADGGWFVYSDSNFTLWESTGGSAKDARRVAVAGDVAFSLSSDGRKVAFTATCGGCSTPDGDSVAFARIGPVAGSIHRIPRPRNTYDWRPSFSPDGAGIVFSRVFLGRHPRETIFVVPTRGGRAHSLGLHGFDAAFSPNGRWIAYLTNNSLMLAPAAGGAPRRLVAGPRGDPRVVFSWSPNSSDLAYATDLKLGTVDLAGTRTAFSLTNLRPTQDTPQWSRDGKSIAFSAIPNQPDSGPRVYVINADGSSLRRIA